MKRNLINSRLFSGCALLSVLLFSLPSFAFSIFACEPEWGALAGEIGRDKVTVYNATQAAQDVHKIQARPSLIARIRQADLVVCTGAELETDWLPILLQRGGNRKVQRPPGLFYAANQLALIGVPEKIDRSAGDIHLGGNPHVHLDPSNIVLIGEKLNEVMAQLSPENAVYFSAQFAAFKTRFTEAMKQWDIDKRPLNGVKVIVHHDQWLYLNRWLGLEQVGTLEPLPGVSPTIGHMSELKSTVHRLVIRAAFKDEKPSQWMLKNGGGCAAVLPYTVGGAKQAQDLIGLFQYTLDVLLKSTECK